MAKCRECRLWTYKRTLSLGDCIDDSGIVMVIDSDADLGLPCFVPGYVGQQPLVDVLGEALRMVWDRRYTDGDESGVAPGYTIRLTPAECDRVQSVLIRYQREVGDAED